MLLSAKTTSTMSKRALNQNFQQKLKFDHEVVVSGNDNMNFTDESYMNGIQNGHINPAYASTI